jgi:hypothetical protein
MKRLMLWRLYASRSESSSTLILASAASIFSLSRAKIAVTLQRQRLSETDPVLRRAGATGWDRS